MIVETVRTRLDAVYLEALADADGHATDDDVQDLTEEVESLYAEILPVAHMCVEQNFLEPALKAVDAHGQGGGGMTAAVGYVSFSPSFLAPLTSRLTHVSSISSREHLR